MNPVVRSLRPCSVAFGLLAGMLPAQADDHVVLIATASEEYSRGRLDASGQRRVESYVVMEGKDHAGITADRSAATTSFRQIVGFLAPELAKQQYLPTRDPATADLLLTVHRGTTTPRITSDQMRNVVSFDIERKEEREMFGNMEVNLRIQQELNEKDGDIRGDVGRRQDNARLLGYYQQLGRMKDRAFSTAEESAMRTDVATERYFLIVRAYDLKAKRAGRASGEPVWVLYANMSTAGQNFATAFTQMSVAAKDYFGRSTDGVQTMRPAKGNVRLAPLVIEDDLPAKRASPPPAQKSP